jgi:phospholipase/carboxylesterase
MRHIFEKGTRPELPTLVLFHGTGGTEHDLLPLAKKISPESSLLSIRGNVLENGMSRFFRRLAEGIFDEADLIFRTKEIHDFLDEAAIKYDFDRGNLVAIGYSNGANIAGSLLFHFKQTFMGAILHHPMVPQRDIVIPNMSGIPNFIGAGTNDPICAPKETEELQELLGSAGANVSVHWERFGHQLTASEVDAAAVWFHKHFMK